MRNFAIFTILLVTLFASGRTKKPITCEAGHFTVGENASLACHFHQNMTSSQHHVYVIHYPFHAPKNFSGNDVLKCSDLSDGVPQCRVAEGYQFNSEITDCLTVRIPDVTELFAGTYVCQLVPPDDTQMIMCNLTVEEQVATETSQALTPSVSYTTLPQQLRSNEETIVAVSVTLSAVIVILLAIILYLIIKNRIYKSQRRTQEKTSPLLQNCDDSTIPKDVDGQQCDSAYNTIIGAPNTLRPSIIPPKEAE
ncbi:hypothetical protein V1264_016711 [Littorina saxatilis]|uniref:Immunoglobulin subtype domain-containing protein n=1 Tax=Littorina saxatilis TaxID=31220 RepID=A0AAN9BL70_9CAEN